LPSSYQFLPLHTKLVLFCPSYLLQELQEKKLPSFNNKVFSSAEWLIFLHEKCIQERKKVFSTKFSSAAHPTILNEKPHVYCTFFSV